MKNERERMDIMSAYREVGSYRGAAREDRDLAGLIAHHDHGVQYLSVAYSEHYIRPLEAM